MLIYNLLEWVMINRFSDVVLNSFWPGGSHKTVVVKRRRRAPNKRHKTVEETFVAHMTTPKQRHSFEQSQIPYATDGK
ncbi:hypothetical protein Tcan_13188 [Toxocara canis]|uniref:Uncharacterized protein n=1 Tax=Toxocara canis TaxID=6265 RepID=A0A0B2VZD0_TOXCA|nr:hypothetical protein Tcan_13188 [Toxocara canis]